MSPVLTAHPTEARRRTLLVALRRIGRLLERLADPDVAPDEDAEIRRLLRGEIATLWRTAEIRSIAPAPARRGPGRPGLLRRDAVHGRADGLPGGRRRPGSGRRATAARPDAGAALAADAGRTGTRPPAVPAFLRFGSWIGADRDGNPSVTAETTLHAMRIQADHLLRGYEAVATRLMQTVAAAVPAERLDAALAREPSSETARTCPRPRASSAAGSRTSPTASGSVRSPSGSGGRGPA